MMEWVDIRSSNFDFGFQRKESISKLFSLFSHQLLIQSTIDRYKPRKVDSIIYGDP